MMSLFLIILIFFMSSCSKPDLPDPPPKTISTPLPHQDPSERQFGLLAPPDLSSHLKKLSTKNIQLHPTITNRILPSGRYFDMTSPLPGLLTVACVRGVDLFEVQESGEIICSNHFDTPGHAWSLISIGDMLLVADDYAGVAAIDLYTGQICAQWSELVNARSFHQMDSGLIVVCRHNKGVTIVEPNDDTILTVLTHLSPRGKVFAASSYEDTIYLGTLGGGYAAVDISNIQKPRELWTFDGPERILWCQRIGDFHFLADQDQGLWILQDNGLEAPEKINLIDFQEPIRRGIMFSEHLLLLAGAKHLRLLDIHNPIDIRELSQVSAENEGRSVCIMDGTIFYSDNDLGIKEYQISSEYKLVPIAQYDHEELLTDVVLSGKTALATHTRGGLEIVRIPPPRLFALKNLKQFDYAVGIDVQNDIAAVTDYQGLKLLDVRSPEHPNIISSLDTPGRASGVCISGQTAFIADWFDGVHLIDISDPEHPLKLSTIPVTGWAIDVEVSDHFAYICCVNGGLITVDISDRHNPRITATETRCKAPEGIAIGKGVLYQADFNSGLIVYDLSHPDQPKAVSYYALNVCKGVQIRDNLLLLGNYIYGVKFFDISDPFNPILIGEVDTPGKAYETAFIPGENAALVADWHGLLRVEW